MGIGSGEKEGESFQVFFSAAQCWLGTVAEQSSAWSASMYIIDELTKVGSGQRSSTIQYDSKSKHSKRRQTVN